MNPYLIERLTEERHHDLRRLAGPMKVPGPRPPVDALLLDHPVLSSRLRPAWLRRRSLRRAGAEARPGWAGEVVEDELRRARRLVSQLPVPAGDPAAPAGARYESAWRELQAALAALAGTSPADAPADTAARLRAAGVISAPAAEAAAALAAVLAAGAAGQVGDPSVELAAAATGERLSAYLASRAGSTIRSVRSSSSSRSTTSANVPPAATTARCLT